MTSLSEMEGRLIVLCSTQRSGSTMICDDIKNTQYLGLPNEFFLGFVNNQDRDWDDFKTRLKDSSSTSNGCRAIKVMASQVEGVVSRYNFLMKEEYSFSQVMDTLGKLSYLRIIRKDKVQQAISRLMAGRTGVYHYVNFTKKGYGLTVSELDLGSDYNSEVNIGYEEIYEAIKVIEAEERYWDYFFTSNHLPLQIVSYEDAVNNLDYISTVLKLHGIEDKKCLTGLLRARNVRCLANKYSRYLYGNYNRSDYVRTNVEQ